MDTSKEEMRGRRMEGGKEGRREGGKHGGEAPTGNADSSEKGKRREGGKEGRREGTYLHIGFFEHEAEAWQLFVVQPGVMAAKASKRPSGGGREGGSDGWVCSLQAQATYSVENEEIWREGGREGRKEGGKEGGREGVTYPSECSSPSRYMSMASWRSRAYLVTFSPT